MISTGSRTGGGRRNYGPRWLFYVSSLFAFMEMSACTMVGALPFSGDSWKEEVLLHDGSKIIVERTVERGGRHEVGQKPPYKEQRLRFTMPRTTQTVTWEDHYSDDLGQANFLPMALDVVEGTPYLVVYPMGCLSYNKWGRPNPPYVVFHYHDKKWTRTPLQELPTDITTPNVLFSQPDVEVERFGKRVITADMIKGVIAGYKQPEFKTILRTPVKAGSEGSTANCEEMIHYKCGWINPQGTFGREYMDRTCK
ncbi:MAG: hypothetical protein Nkreftii_001595 [Candidatus Nitrospira kreftii]|uniref:Uncharacterized protein n=1 Tax=Candidatus Nitrospira kreftii TaxID=2652173 RepID=A0A7S8FDI7_9BACT|nr:MAG: hypothetical protein Nkreftii_001595 [Candidatus Nitrospira kreftii]